MSENPMRSVLPFALLSVLVAGLAACAPPATTSAPLVEPTRDPGAAQWTVTTRPVADLWYHGLTLTDFGASADIPMYRPACAEAASAAKRSAGAFPAVLDRRAEEFARRFRADCQRELATVPAAVQAEWDRLAPRLQPFLDYLMLNSGELMLTLPLGSEGRTVDLGGRANRIAVGMPSADAPADPVGSSVHEPAYPLVSQVIADKLSSAQRRETDEQLLRRRSAIRAGAMLLDRVAPESAAEYRAAHVRWAGVAVPARGPKRERAFSEAYPLPGAIGEAVGAGLGGI